MNARTAIKTSEATVSQETKPPAQQETEGSARIRTLIEETMFLYNDSRRQQAAAHFVKGLHSHPDIEVRTYAFTGELERKLTDLVGRLHTREKFIATLTEVRERFLAFA